MIGDMRRQAVELFSHGVAAAAPGPAVARALAQWPIPNGSVRVLAVGKAAMAMAGAALEQLGDTVRSAIVVTNAENAGDLPGARVLVAGHPVPDAAGLEAARVVEAEARAAAQGETVLVLISGGGSALLPSPIEGISLADKARVSQLMLAGGLSIHELNLVRQCLSRLKGGGLARLCAPAQVVALVLSDVIGDDLRVVASGPTMAAIGQPCDAVDLLKTRQIWDDMPATVQQALLRSGSNEQPTIIGQTHLIGSNEMSLKAMQNQSGAEIWSQELEGDVQQAASWLAERIRTAPPGPLTAICGGETTVTLTGTGRGGRNQELALRVALELDGFPRPYVVLSGGTDGRDGPTNAAGGVVDNGTLARIRAAGGELRSLLANNDSYAALHMANDLLMTGGTGTNVADLQVICLA